MLGELATTSQGRAAEYRIRKNRYAQRTFRKDEVEFAASEGWELVRENQNSLRYQKLKSHDEQLENEFWCLMYSFGYPHLNVGRSFHIEITSDKKTTVTKQIDVFAYDEETIIIAECKSAEKRTKKKKLPTKIGEFAANQKSISNTLRRYFGGKFAQKIIWMFVTRNIEWSDSDRARAAELNVRVITERELLYYKEIAKRIGHSARYQFHAEFLENTKVSALEHKVFAIRTQLGAQRAYAFFATPKDVLPITFVNHRDLRDPNAAPAYQRLIHRPRLRDIANFLRAGGYFPNSVILNFKRKVRFDILKPEDESGIAPGELTLPNTYKSAWIIDGQHRLYSYAELEGDEQAANLPFLAFEGISIPDETRIFAEINSKQKSVPKKLLDEIAGEIKLDSANKREQMRAIASRVFDLLRDDDDGPLGDKIAGAEVKRSDDSVLTIPFLVDATLQSGLLGRTNQQAGETVFIQGPLYWDGPKDAIEALSEVISAFLDQFRAANPERWESGRAGKFATNPGVAGLIRLLADLVAFMSHKENEDPRELHAKIVAERVEKYAEPCVRYFKSATDDDVGSRFQVPFGGSGPRVFQHRLRELVRGTFGDFNPQGFEADLRKYDEARRQDADKKVRQIQDSVHGFVIRKLREIYPFPSDEYLAKAVDNKDILKKAFDKQIDADDDVRKDLGTYLDFIDLRKIVEIPRNFEHFKPTLNLPLPSEPKGRAKYLGWFDEINKLRRVSAHPYNRGYDDAQIEQLDLIHKVLSTRQVIPGDK